MQNNHTLPDNLKEWIITEVFGLFKDTDVEEHHNKARYRDQWKHW